MPSYHSDIIKSYYNFIHDTLKTEDNIFDPFYDVSLSGKNRTKAESGQKQAANADPSRKAVGAVIAGENARKAK